MCLTTTVAAAPWCRPWRAARWARLVPTAPRPCRAQRADAHAARTVEGGGGSRCHSDSPPHLLEHRGTIPVTKTTVLVCTYVDRHDKKKKRGGGGDRRGRKKEEEEKGGGGRAAVAAARWVPPSGVVVPVGLPFADARSAGAVVGVLHQRVEVQHLRGTRTNAQGYPEPQGYPEGQSL